MDPIRGQVYPEHFDPAQCKLVEGLGLFISLGGQFASFIAHDVAFKYRSKEKVTSAWHY